MGGVCPTIRMCYTYVLYVLYLILMDNSSSPNPELLDFTDRLGIYVMDENRNFANVTQYFNDAHLMVVRDRYLYGYQ